MKTTGHSDATQCLKRHQSLIIKRTISKGETGGIGDVFDGMVVLKKYLTVWNFWWRSILSANMVNELYLKYLSVSLEQCCETKDVQEEVRTCKKEHINGLHKPDERTWPFNEVHSVWST